MAIGIEPRAGRAPTKGRHDAALSDARGFQHWGVRGCVPAGGIGRFGNRGVSAILVDICTGPAATARDQHRRVSRRGDKERAPATAAVARIHVWRTRNAGTADGDHEDVSLQQVKTARDERATPAFIPAVPGSALRAHRSDAVGCGFRHDPGHDRPGIFKTNIDRRRLSAMTARKRQQNGTKFHG
ncbi:hypothetical protein E4Z66_10540 [Aliishimia ponticola]|uniref:Uncharacterized protein n=1 Tax=Aliishimia ponticola TaxID=2499833 RepID=A0A4V3XKL5_9RHOB|nr:hypothetical protein E4Z66_10540 [Aliishimia ponticola]